MKSFWNHNKNEKRNLAPLYYMYNAASNFKKILLKLFPSAIEKKPLKTFNTLLLTLYTIIDPLSKLPESIFSVECKVK